MVFHSLWNEKGFKSITVVIWVVASHREKALKEYTRYIMVSIVIVLSSLLFALVRLGCCSKLPGTVGLKQQTFLSHCLGGWGVLVGVPGASRFSLGDSCLPDFQMSAFLPCPYRGERKLPFFVKELISLRGSNVMTSSKRNYLCKGPPPNIHHSGMVPALFHVQNILEANMTWADH